MNFGEILLDALIDCLKLLPFLFLTIFLMEYVEHRAGKKFLSVMQRSGRFGPLLGAALGCVPQCGFSAACAQLYNGGLVTAGTLLAVFLSTSDEALPILIARPQGWRSVLMLLAAKLVIAVIIGFLVDIIWTRERQQAAFIESAEAHVCDSDSHMRNILIAALKRTGGIMLFLFLITLILGALMEWIGEERLATFMLPGFFQPVLAALIGLIPNCAASVLLTRLYMDGMITFGSAVAGLSSAAGVGLLVLIRGKRPAKTILLIVGLLFLSAVLAGSLLQLFM